MPRKRLGHGRMFPVPLVALSLTVACDSGIDPTSESDQAPVSTFIAASEPPGYTPITDRAFNAKVEDGWTASSSPLFTIETDATAPRSPSNVGQMLYPAGFVGGGEPAWTERVFSGLTYTRIYASFWIIISANWQGHDSHVNKVGFFWIHDDPAVFPNIVGKDDGPLSPEIWLQNIPDIFARNLTPNVNAVEFTRGGWHHWGIVLVSNTGDNADGQAHWWLDGVKVGQYLDVKFGTALQGKVWQSFNWRPIWGGVGDVVLLPMYMQMDHIYVSGSP